MIDCDFSIVINASDANGFKIPTEIVLEADASPKHLQMKSMRSPKILKYDSDRELLYSPSAAILYHKLLPD